MLEEAENDAAGAAILASIADPRSYAHDIHVLAAGRILRGWHNKIGLVPPGKGRSADLRVLSHDVAIEVKAARELADAETIVTRSAADVAARVLDRSSEQRGAARASLLIVGGYRLPTFIREALAEHLAAASHRRPELIGSIVLSLASHPVD